MGNNTYQGINSPIRTEEINKSSFKFISIIGKGGFGKVWRVKLKKNNEEYAMKEMSKVKIIDKKSISSIFSERDLLSKMRHPFIVNMYFSFQDKDNLYLVMNLLLGGDLRYHICKRRRFSEDQAKFFISCIILGLEFFHSNEIIHRDIKPENLVLDEKGYIKITDLGIAKKKTAQNKGDTSGTPGYMSPEVMCGQNHSYTADYFAVGIIGYELMNGVRPYIGKNRKEIKEKIMERQVFIKKDDIPEGWTLEAADCINRLMIRKPALRLGRNGINEIKDHIWFKGFPWKELYNKRLVSTFIPPPTDNFDAKFCNKVDIITEKTQKRYEEIMSKESYETNFKDYLYFNIYDNNVIHYKTFKNPHIIYENVSREVDDLTDYVKKKKRKIIYRNKSEIGRLSNITGINTTNKIILNKNNIFGLDNRSWGNTMANTGSTIKNSGGNNGNIVENYGVIK